MANHRAAALLVASLLVVAIAVADVQATPISTGLVCSKVHGVQAGETCFAVAKAARLTLQQFLAFNPNINCNKLFVGQWICLAAAEA
ncbi:hypothetical protein ACP4OV_002388 [Aristida adscensionis]